MTDLTGVFEEGEYGYRAGMVPRTWHNEFIKKREASIRGHGAGQHIFNLYAGTGSGKTCAAAMAAADDLNLGRARRVVACVPSSAIAANVQETFRDRFGIHLALFSARRHKHGVTSDQQGYIVTYQAVARRASTHRRISTYEPTLVVFDEIHHLGDGESWGDAARLAFGGVPFVLTMTGSPIRRRDTGLIPFATYEPTDDPEKVRYVADYRYPLGRAILDGFCREPDFRFSDDVIVKVRPAGTDREITVSFADQVSDNMAQLRLSAAVQYGSPARATMLSNALAEIRAARRKAIIFLGGDTAESSTPTGDATMLLPSELEALGIGPDEYVVITMNDKDPHAKIKAFRESKTAWILITVNMVSEGVDAPEVSAAIFLTTWVSDLSFIQRIGRALRYMGNGDPRDAWFYLFHHPSYLRASLEIKNEWNEEIALRAKRQREEGVRQGDGPPRHTEAIAISGGNHTFSVWNGERYPAELYAEALRKIDERKISKAFLSDIIDQLRRERGYGDGGDCRQPA